MAEGQSQDRVGAEPLALGDRVLDRYRVVQRIAKGGHSVVYRGEDERLSRPVCLKVFHNLRAESGVYRTSYEHFVQEAFALSRLTHPNTLRIYDFGHLDTEDADAGGAPFQVSEFMNGGTLWRVVRDEGPLPIDEVVRVVSNLCGALAEAHDCGIVHRDIKPKNILFGTAGPNRVAKLADFGIAKSLPVESESLRNRAGDTAIVAGHRLVMYSPSWAAPEQLVGQAVTPAADTYSLALVTSFMLSGVLVFQSRDIEDAYRERGRADEAIDAALDGAGLPPGVIDVLKEACRYDPAQRTGCVGDFARAFERAVSAGAAAEPITTPFNRASAELLSGGRAGAVTVPPRRLQPSEDAVAIADRQGRFVALTANSASVAGGNGRLRLTFLPGTGGVSLHIKGLNCFVSHKGRPPSAALNLTGSAGIEMVAPNRKPMGSVQVHFGSPAAGHRIFTIGDETVAIGCDDCPLVVALDFGPGAECLFLYNPAVIADRDGRGSRRRRNST